MHPRRRGARKKVPRRDHIGRQRRLHIFYRGENAQHIIDSSKKKIPIKYIPP